MQNAGYYTRASILESSFIQLKLHYNFNNFDNDVFQLYHTRYTLSTEANFIYVRLLCFENLYFK